MSERFPIPVLSSEPDLQLSPPRKRKRLPPRKRSKSTSSSKNEHWESILISSDEEEDANKLPKWYQIPSNAHKHSTPYSLKIDTPPVIRKTCPEPQEYNHYCARLVPGWEQVYDEIQLHNQNKVVNPLHVEEKDLEKKINKLRRITHPDKLHQTSKHPLASYRHCVEFTKSCDSLRDWKK